MADASMTSSSHHEHLTMPSSQQDSAVTATEVNEEGSETHPIDEQDLQEPPEEPTEEPTVDDDDDEAMIKETVDNSMHVDSSEINQNESVVEDEDENDNSGGNKVIEGTSSTDSSQEVSSRSDVVDVKKPVASSSVAAAANEMSRTVSKESLASSSLLSDKNSATSSAPDILSLPMDSLHSIASFLTPAEWCDFGQTSRSGSRVCCEIIRRVRLHGFRCATEVATAWKLGEHEDAKELAALYIQAGVPIYPRSLGHSYHTLLWRMSVEAREIDESQENLPTDENSSSNREAETPGSNIDPFYAERLDFRSREGYSPEISEISYLTEKCLFWMDKKGIEAGDAGMVLLAFGPNRPPSPVTESTSGGEVVAASGVNSAPALQRPSSSQFGTKMPLKIHQHLLDQHKLGRNCVNDQDGSMVTPPVNLSADFFHPSKSGSKRSNIVLPDRKSVEEIVGELVPPEPVFIWTEETAVAEREPPQAADREIVAEFHGEGDLLDEGQEMDNQETLFEPATRLSASKLRSALSLVDIELYSSSLTAAPKDDVVDGAQELKRHLRSRFSTYQRRLEAFLARSDHSGFDECILDFWDEFFPHSAGIQYFDLHTPVPRISCLQKFLTKPCPKAIGTVQCEIERIKISSRGKGMKSRLWPTYEYRLFIRNHTQDSSIESTVQDDDSSVRRDTVLMAAKNRGRKHAEEPGVVPMSSSSKKGSNNYYLYMPQQSDVDAHFNKVNDPEHPSKMNPNGASNDPVLLSNDASSILLGRLQSNFIGTEFQIYTPHLRKRCRRKPEPQSAIYSPSDDDLDYDSGVSSDNNSTRRSRFGRLSLRRNANLANPDYSTDDEYPDRHHKRSASCPDLQQGRQPRTNRRAIANTPDSQYRQPTLCEEEDGAIIYTANLLGSRPRIMDVCIPKVTPEGVAGAEWRRYLENCDDTDDYRMLSCFRQLQQRLETPDQNAPADEENDDSESEVDETPDDFGLLALQNRPPWWNIELGSFVLNFGGRVSVASVKNFQLCDRSDQDRILLQFGRIQGRHSFTMDFQHPLTAVQAFSIAISSLQSKISFG